MEFRIISSQELGTITNMIENISTEVKEIIRKSCYPLEEKWLDNQEVCRLLKVSQRTLQNYRDKRTLPFSTMGGKVFYKAADIESVLSKNYSVNK